MFADGGTQSLGTVASSLGTGMLRETQATHQFSATQDVAGPGSEFFICHVRKLPMAIVD